MNYTCLPRLELQAVAHLHMFSKLELYMTDELAHELSGVCKFLTSSHDELNIKTRNTTSKGFARATRPTLPCSSPKTSVIVKVPEKSPGSSSLAEVNQSHRHIITSSHHQKARTRERQNVRRPQGQKHQLTQTL